MALSRAVVGGKITAAIINAIIDKFAIKQKFNGVSSTIAEPRLQFGIEKITPGAVAVANTTFTFPDAYAATPLCVGFLIGQKPTAGFDPTSTVQSSVPFTSTYGHSTTGSSISIRAYTGTLTAATDYYVAWIAIGTPA